MVYRAGVNGDAVTEAGKSQEDLLADIWHTWLLCQAASGTCNGTRNLADMQLGGRQMFRRDRGTHGVPRRVGSSHALSYQSMVRVDSPMK
jgi:hypothetical protein